MGITIIVNQADLRRVNDKLKFLMRGLRIHGKEAIEAIAEAITDQAKINASGTHLQQFTGNLVDGIYYEIEAEGPDYRRMVINSSVMKDGFPYGQFWETGGNIEGKQWEVSLKAHPELWAWAEERGYTPYWSNRLKSYVVKVTARGRHYMADAVDTVRPDVRKIALAAVRRARVEAFG